jgi:putative SOS response-associated peptidase YedK
MCGRYTLAGKPVDLEKQLRANLYGTAFNQSFNIAPGSAVTAVLSNNPNTLIHVKWGLTPSWSASNDKPLFLINLRDDTLKTKPGFKRYLKNRRCIVPASGFYEWKPEGKQKQPYYFHCLNQEFMFFAGIWETSNAEVQPREMVAILTTAANSLVEPIHNRMPVILKPEEARTWLEHDNTEELISLLHPYPAEEMECWPVSQRVNKAGIDDDSLIISIKPDAPHQSQLF